MSPGMTVYVSNGPLTEHSADPVITSRFNTLLRGPMRDLKTFLRAHHVPLNDSLRQRLWLECLAKRCGAALPKDDGGSASNASQVGETNGCEDLPGLPAFVEEKYAVAFHLNERGRRTVARLIRRLLILHPDITYAPLLYAVLALLLHYMDESKALFCVELLLKQRSRAIYDLPHTKRDWQIHCKMLEALAPGHAKKMARCLRADVDHDSQADVFRWMQWLLRLPFVYLVRLLDVYMVEGFKVLVRAGLLFLRLLFTHSLQRSSARPIPNLDAMAITLADDMARVMPVDQFVRAIFRRIRRFSRRELERLHQHWSAHPELLPIIDIPLVSVTPVDVSNLVNPSALVDAGEFAHIYRWLPQRITLMSHRRVFSSEQDGCTLRTLYQHSEGLEPTILLVRTTRDELFGAYCSTDWAARLKGKKACTYFGTGESFVFTVRPEVAQHPWVGKASPNLASSLPAHCEWFQAGDNTQLMVGGGEGCVEAIRLDEMMEKGRSAKASTFDNPGLAPLSGPDFRVTAVEVIGFE